MPLRTAKQPSQMASDSTTPKRSRKKSVTLVYPLEYMSDEGSRLKHEKLWVHNAAFGLAPLPDRKFEMLKEQIIRSDGSINLTTRILVSHRGSIADGRHRARVLVEAGHGDELVKQIKAGGGRWVTQLPKGTDIPMLVARTQLARRNCPAWQVALTLIGRYRKAVRKGKARQGKRRGAAELKSPVDAFCESAGISATTFHQVERIERLASPKEIEDLYAERTSLKALDRKLRAAEKASQPPCAADAPPCGSGGHDHGENSVSTGRRTNRLADRAGSEPEGDEFEQAVGLINRLLQPDPKDYAEGPASVSRCICLRERSRFRDTTARCRHGDAAALPSCAWTIY